MIPAILSLIFAMPNQPMWDILASHWLEVKTTETREFDPNVPVKHTFTVWPCDNNRDTYLVIRCKDPNDSLQVTSWRKNRMGYSDFCLYARQYTGDPNYVKPVEPNEPAEPNMAGVTDPNLIKAIMEMLK